MKTNELFNLINNPEIFELNQVQRSAHKKTFGINDQSLDFVLNGVWNINYYSDIVERDEEFYNKTKLSSTIQIPSNFELHGYGQLHYVNTQYPWDGVEDLSIGQTPRKVNYCFQLIKNFDYKINDDNKYSICFEGVESAFNLWLNGQYIGYSTDAYTTSEFDITENLIDGENSIAIEIYKYTASSWLDDQDFWRMSGIIRDVYIREKTVNYVDDHSISYEINSSTMTVNISLKNQTNNLEDIYLELIDPLGNILYDDVVKKQIELENIMLWNFEEPNLYKFKFKSTTEYFVQKIGFRTIRLDDGTYTLNGERIIFKGINRHEFSNKRGRAITRNDIRADVQLLKESNFNAIRTSHYPNQPVFYEYCDELGLLVIDEVNLETHGSWYKNGGVNLDQGYLPGDNKKYELSVLKRAQNLYERDKNFTSVIMWSLGNESYGGSTLNKMYKYFKAVDKSRFVHYEGVFWDRSFPKLSDIESQMYITSELVEEWLIANPQKPYMLCEYSHAMGNSNGNLMDYIKLEKYENYHGGFIWEYMDQAIEKDGMLLYGGDFGDRPTDYNFICDGLVGANREVTDELRYVTDIFDPMKISKDKNQLIIENNFIYLNEVAIRVSIESHDKVDKHFEICLSKNKMHVIENIEDYKKIVISYLNKTQNIVINQQLNSNNVVAKQKLEFIDGDWNFGIRSKNLDLLFSKNHNSLASLKYKGKQIFKDVKGAFRPNFWRPFTNNEIGAGIDDIYSIWQVTSRYQKAKIKSYEFSNNELVVLIEYTYPHFKDYKFDIEYKVNEEEEIKVSYKLYAQQNNIPIQCVGIKALLDNEFNKFEYIGNGPYANYCDRKEGMLNANYKSSTREQDNYIYPQEANNRTDVSQLSIHSEAVRMWFEFSKPIDFSLISNSDEEIEIATNKSELTNSKVQLKINSYNTGVAGDDSWGNVVKSKYSADITEDNTLSFIVRFALK